MRKIEERAGRSMRCRCEARRRRGAGDGGQSLPLVVLLVLVAVATVLVLGAIGGVLHDRARAQAAADAAALAGAAEGREAAADLAEANDGVLESFEEGGADVRVVVRVGRARAEAQARRGAVPDSG